MKLRSKKKNLTEGMKRESEFGFRQNSSDSFFGSKASKQQTGSTEGRSHKKVNHLMTNTSSSGIACIT